MASFDGKLIIFQGGKAGWGGHTSDGGPGDTYLLHIRGTNQYNTKAEQVIYNTPITYLLHITEEPTSTTPRLNR